MSRGAQSEKITTILPKRIYDAIEQLAKKERRTMSAATALLLEDCLRERDLLPDESPTTVKRDPYAY